MLNADWVWLSGISCSQQKAETVCIGVVPLWNSSTTRQPLYTLWESLQDSYIPEEACTPETPWVTALQHYTNKHRQYIYALKRADQDAIAETPHGWVHKSWRRWGSTAEHQIHVPLFQETGLSEICFSMLWVAGSSTNIPFTKNEGTGDIWEVCQQVGQEGQ